MWQIHLLGNKIVESVRKVLSEVVDENLPSTTLFKLINNCIHQYQLACFELPFSTQETHEKIFESVKEMVRFPQSEVSFVIEAESTLLGIMRKIQDNTKNLINLQFQNFMRRLEDFFRDLVKSDGDMIFWCNHFKHLVAKYSQSEKSHHGIEVFFDFATDASMEGQPYYPSHNSQTDRFDISHNHTPDTMEPVESNPNNDSQHNPKGTSHIPDATHLTPSSDQQQGSPSQTTSEQGMSSPAPSPPPKSKRKRGNRKQKQSPSSKEIQSKALIDNPALYAQASPISLPNFSSIPTLQPSLPAFPKLPPLRLENVSESPQSSLRSAMKQHVEKLMTEKPPKKRKMEGSSDSIDLIQSSGNQKKNHFLIDSNFR